MSTPEPDVWDLLDRPDVLTFIRYCEHVAYERGHSAGVNAEYARQALIPARAQAYQNGYLDGTEAAHHPAPSTRHPRKG